MARNGSGTYSLPQPPFTPGTTIASSAVNSDLSDIAAALTQSISKDGQTVYTGNQPMGGNKLTGLGVGSALTDSVRLSQVADGAINYGGVAGGTADAITLSPVPGITAYAVGQTFTFKAAANNTGPVTVDVSTVGAGALTWPDGSALAALDIAEDGTYEIEVADTTPIFHLQTGGNASATQAVGNNSRKNATTAFVQAAVGKVYQQVFTSSGTYTPHAGMVNCIIECIGGGGAGGGANGALSQVNVGGGGGSGGYSRKLATASDIGASKTVTIGAGGTAGTAGPNAGNNGGDTSVGSLCIGKGGTGGGGTDSSTSVGAAGAGGVAGTGDVAASGASGNSGFGANTSAVSVFGAAGGSSIYGGGAAPAAFFGTGSANGAAATAYGSGGGGGYTSNVVANVTGGAGSAGIVIITEYCNQ